MNSLIFENSKQKESGLNDSTFRKQKELSSHNQSFTDKNELIQSKVWHDFGKIDIESDSLKKHSCTHLNNSSYCPYGGACHSCPVRIQPKLIINQPGDIFEQEADRISKQIISIPESKKEEKEPCLWHNYSKNVQFNSLGTTESIEAPLIVHETLHSSGQPLDPSIHDFMGLRFGYDFGQVRVHNDEKAACSARLVNAKAYTVGNDVVFGTGLYAPQTTDGQRLLAHELTHVVQQNMTYNKVKQFGLYKKNADKKDNKLIKHQDLNPSETKANSIVFTTAPMGILQGLFVTPLGAAGGYGGLIDRDRRRILDNPNPLVTITRQRGQGNSFVSTDLISFTANVEGITEENRGTSQPNWTVQGLSPNSGNGNPHNAVNKSNFSFVPNPTNRLTTGTHSPNTPIKYRIDAKVGETVANFTLEQDETDIIRQEYLDFGAASPPSRMDIVSPTNPIFNTGNYTQVIDNGMNKAFSNTQTEFNLLTNQANNPMQTQHPSGAVPPLNALGPPQPPNVAAALTNVPVPAISVNCGYRNPRRNVAAGSQFHLTSRHVYGSALDLNVAGANATLWARLRQAGTNSGYTSICEHNAAQLPCDDPTINHVHIQW